MSGPAEGGRSEPEVERRIERAREALREWDPVADFAMGTRIAGALSFLKTSPETLTMSSSNWERWRTVKRTKSSVELLDQRDAEEGFLRV